MKWYHIVGYILFAAVFRISIVNSREVCHDYYRGQQWRAARCPDFCCGSKHYTYCCDDCKESVHPNSCDKHQSTDVPHYSGEVMFIAGLCGVSGVGLLILFCILTLLVKQCCKHELESITTTTSTTIRIERRLSRNNCTNQTTTTTTMTTTRSSRDPAQVIPQGVPLGEKCKFYPPPSYNSSETTPSCRYTPPPPYESRENLPISPEELSHALLMQEVTDFGQIQHDYQVEMPEYEPPPNYDDSSVNRI